MSLENLYKHEQCEQKSKRINTLKYKAKDKADYYNKKYKNYKNYQYTDEDC